MLRRLRTRPIALGILILAAAAPARAVQYGGSTPLADAPAQIQERSRELERLSRELRIHRARMARVQAELKLIQAEVMRREAQVEALQAEIGLLQLGEGLSDPAGRGEAEASRRDQAARREREQAELERRQQARRAELEELERHARERAERQDLERRAIERAERREREETERREREETERRERDRDRERAGREGPGDDPTGRPRAEASTAQPDVLRRLIVMPFPDRTALREVLDYLREQSRIVPSMPQGFEFDLQGRDIERRVDEARVQIKEDRVSWFTALRQVLDQAGLTTEREGTRMIIRPKFDDPAADDPDASAPASKDN